MPYLLPSDLPEHMKWVYIMLTQVAPALRPTLTVEIAHWADDPTVILGGLIAIASEAPGEYVTAVLPSEQMTADPAEPAAVYKGGSPRAAVIAAARVWAEETAIRVADSPIFAYAERLAAPGDDRRPPSPGSPQLGAIGEPATPAAPAERPAGHPADWPWPLPDDWPFYKGGQRAA